MPLPLERQNQVIVERLQRTFDDLIAVYRFGSTAQGTATRTSDADIAVLTRERVAPERRFHLQEGLAAEIGCDVDLVDLANASPVMAIQVIARGELSPIIIATRFQQSLGRFIEAKERLFE